jgi:hypothetical protein
MKARRSRFLLAFAVVLLAALGLVSSQAGAADVTVGFEPPPGQYVVGYPGDTVNLNVYAYMPDMASNTGIQDLYGALYSGTGGLLGNLSFTAAPGLQAAGFSNGTQQDLDGDGDLDVGGRSNTSPTDWIHVHAGLGAFVPVIPGTNKVLLGTATFAVTYGWYTSITWHYFPYTAFPIDSYVVDGVKSSVKGTSNALASSPLWVGPLEHPPITIDENGHGWNPVGYPMPFRIGQDPGPEGLANALIYGPMGVPGTLGDLRIFKSGDTQPSAIVRFNGDGTVILYSEQLDSNTTLADTGLPGQTYSNCRDIYVSHYGNDWWVDYWAEPNQPGSMLSYTGEPEHYYIMLDIPEPATLPLWALGLLAVIRRRRCVETPAGMA